MKRMGSWILTISLAATAAADSGPSSLKPRVKRFENVPLYFEANQGQTASQVRYMSRGAGHVLWLTDSDAVLKFRDTDSTGTVSLRWVGGRAVTPEAEDRQAGLSNYLIGQDSSKWKTNVPHFGKVRYRSVYPGIDVLYYGKQSKLEYDLVVAPGADPSRIRLQFAGASKVSVQKDGDLLVHAAGSDLRQLRPIAYQDTPAGRRYVRTQYVMASADQVKIKIGRYDSSRPLIIDPVISWSTYLGGTNADIGESIAIDSAGISYVAGQTLSANFTLAGTPYDNSWGGNNRTDAFVAKINAAGTAVLYATYLGGGEADEAHGIAVDTLGNAVITGATTSGTTSPTSTQFPLLNAVDGTFGGGTFSDGFVTKLNASGSGLIFSTFIGGSNVDVARSVAVDSSNFIYIAGLTNSPDFTGAASAGYGGVYDAFVAKFTPAGGIVYSVYQGGAGEDFGVAIAADTAGNAYVAGETNSAGLPGQGFQPGLLGGRDGFISKLNGTGVRQYWAYVGGTGQDVINAIAVDGSGNVYVTGDTVSTDFPLVRPLQSTLSGGIDAFVVKLNSLASAIVFSSYIGGNAEDRGIGVAVDAAGSTVVAGYTRSANFPRINSINASLKGAVDAYVVKYTPSFNARYYSTLIGGDLADTAYGMALDSSGRVYITGQTLSLNFPVTVPGSVLRGAADAFAAQLGGCSVALTPLATGIGARGGRRAILVQTSPADCPWAATTGSTFISFASPASGTGNGALIYDVAPNPDIARSGSITITGQVIPISQQGSITAGCAYTVSQPSVPAIGASGGAGSITITAASTCSWSVYTNFGWAQVYPITGAGTATINYTLFPNFQTSQRIATITAAGQARTVTQSAGAGTVNQRLVQLIYFSFLGRLPSQAEIDFQAGQLNAGTPRGELILNFYNTEEFNLGGRFIDGLYVGLLDRDAEYDGWLFQRNALVTGGLPQSTLVSNFLAAQEYALRFGAPNNTEFVRLLYRHVLLREASQQEVNAQAANLNGGVLNRVQMAGSFLNSAEFKGGTGPRLTAFLLYATLLQRDPSLAEFDARVREILLSQKTVRQIIDELIATPEFNANLN